MAYIGNNSLPFDPTRTAAQPRDAERFSGNGSTTNFTLSRAVSNLTDVEVFVENVQQEPTTAYNVVGTTLSFTEAPPSGTYNVYVVYRAFNTGAQVYVPDGSITYAKLANNLKLFTTDNLTPNGNNSVFTLSDTPPDANTIIVSVDGIVQRAPVHYTTSGSTITFTSAPPAGANVHVRHLGIRTTQTLTAIAANTTIPQPTITSPNVTGGTYDSITRLGVGVSSNTSYGIINRYYGNSEIATQYGTGTLTGIGAYAATGGIFMDTTGGKIYPMQWDSSGRVTRPYTPSFFAYGGGYGGQYWNNQLLGNYVTGNTIAHNTGSHFSPRATGGTGLFTAPVAGKYFFSWCILKYNSSAIGQTIIQLNGTSAFSVYTESGSSNASGITGSMVVNLAQNDTIGLYCSGGSSTTFYDNGAGASTYGGSSYNWFSGYFMG